MAAPVELITTSTHANLVNVVIENLLGRRLIVRVPKAATVRQLKEEIQSQMQIRISQQTLILPKPNGNADAGYTQLEDAKTLDQYDVNDGERILLVPAMKAAPPGYELRKGNAAKIFVDVAGSSAISQLIDKALAERNEKRNPNAVYALAQFPDQPEGNYTIIQYIPDDVPAHMERPSEIQTATSESNVSIDAPVVDPEKDRQQNIKTKSAMSKLRANIEEKKRKKQKETTKPSCARCGSKIGCKCATQEELLELEKSETDMVPPFSQPRKSSCCIS